jgi:phospholipid/cholesterol/gamma-HCH transport system substrate-binding protein
MSPENARGLARFALLAAVLAILGILFINSKYGIIFGHTQGWSHSIQTVVPQAFEVIPGERMVEGGETVGEITKAQVTKDGRAHIVMGLNDSGWPIQTDSLMTLRMGGTIKYSDRFIEIAKGHAGDYFLNDATVPAKQFITPVEYESLFNIFNTRTRAGMRSLFANGGPTLEQAAKPFHTALPLAPPVLGQATAVFNDLGYDQAALSTLVSSTAQISDAVAQANPGLQTLIQGAANTFSTIAAQSTALNKMVTTGAADLYAVGHVTAHATTTLPKLAVLAQRLQPGITELDRLASPLNDTLREVMKIEPTAVDTLTTVQRSAPTINSLLASARARLFPQLASVSTQGAKEVDCVRPYTPEIVNFLQSWSGFLGAGENNPHINFLHAYLSLFPLPNTMPIDTQQLQSILPGVHVSAPGLPGTNWNQPWYQPQCNVTANSVNPAFDGDAGNLDPNSSKTVSFPTH